MTLTVVAILIAVLCGILLIFRSVRSVEDVSLKANRYSRKIHKSAANAHKVPKKTEPKIHSTVVAPAQPIQESLLETGSSLDSKPAIEVVTLYIKAKQDRPYAGYELLQSILSAGLRFGKINLFHRYTTTQEKILYSLANAKAPGTFDLTKMGAFCSQELALFFKVNSVDDPLETYNMLLNTAGELIEDLGGQVFDDRHELLTPEMVIKTRQQLRADGN